MGILAHGKGHGSAIGGVGEHNHGAVQRGDQLFGPCDAVEITRDGFEAVIHRNGAVTEIFNMLQHGVGQAVGEDIAGQQQHGHAVDVGYGSGGYHVQGARADG